MQPNHHGRYAKRPYSGAFFCNSRHFFRKFIRKTSISIKKIDCFDGSIAKYDRVFGRG